MEVAHSNATTQESGSNQRKRKYIASSDDSLSEDPGDFSPRIEQGVAGSPRTATIRPYFHFDLEGGVASISRTNHHHLSRRRKAANTTIEVSITYLGAWIRLAMHGL
jgi:hypothetical protein